MVIAQAVYQHYLLSTSSTQPTRRHVSQTSTMPSRASPASKLRAVHMAEAKRCRAGWSWPPVLSANGISS